MRYALLSDIHGNLEALTAVLDFLGPQKIDQVLCLGDTVGYGADPAACLARLTQVRAVIVAGNHDQACIGKLNPEWFHEAARAAIIWTRDQLSFADLDVLRRFPLIEQSGAVTLVHATLQHHERFTYLVDVGQAIETLRRCRTLFCCAGHTHIPWMVEYNRQQSRVERILSGAELSSVAFQDNPETMRYLINPGSVGQPRDGDPKASVGILDMKAKHFSLHRVAYDIAKTQAKIRQARLPVFFAERLSLGR